MTLSTGSTGRESRVCRPPKGWLRCAASLTPKCEHPFREASHQAQIHPRTFSFKLSEAQKISPARRGALRPWSTACLPPFTTQRIKRLIDFFQCFQISLVWMRQRPSFHNAVSTTRRPKTSNDAAQASVHINRLIAEHLLQILNIWVRLEGEWLILWYLFLYAHGSACWVNMTHQSGWSNRLKNRRKCIINPTGVTCAMWRCPR